MQFYVCYYGWGDFKKRNAETCNTRDVYDILFIVIAVTPYWLRLLHCIQRWNDGRDSMQALNGLKYFSTIVALVTRISCSKMGGITMKVLNVKFRLGWIQAVMDFRELPFLHRNALTAIFANLEIILRGIWNFFRLENLHLNNVGKFRAVKSVSFPFNYADGYKNM
ncbi:hypothetical protein M8C21_004697 [Ambrosia artemisiifolia]|uniref:EXS domain-containing protein n=1 Tax=Ambrosia artemisiifolia TaxID=4212 RepID=A0AAD5GRB6_AMBAR|nr:hypothetical protein M8C21_004697 [Ambrosia artemisiifolia]